MWKLPSTRIRQRYQLAILLSIGIGIAIGVDISNAWGIVLPSSRLSLLLTPARTRSPRLDWPDSHARSTLPRHLAGHSAGDGGADDHERRRPLAPQNYPGQRGRLA